MILQGVMGHQYFVEPADTGVQRAAAHSRALEPGCNDAETKLMELLA